MALVYLIWIVPSSISEQAGDARRRRAMSAPTPLRDFAIASTKSQLDLGKNCSQKGIWSELHFHLANDRRLRVAHSLIGLGRRIASEDDWRSELPIDTEKQAVSVLSHPFGADKMAG